MCEVSLEVFTVLNIFLMIFQVSWYFWGLGYLVAREECVLGNLREVGLSYKNLPHLVTLKASSQWLFRIFHYVYGFKGVLKPWGTCVKG